MLKKYAWLALFAFMFISAGCGTVKGAGSGLTSGAEDDTKGLWHGVMTADQWVRDNLW